MRLNPPTTVLGILAVVLAGAAYQRHESLNNDHGASCEIALDYVNRSVSEDSRPVIFPEASFAPISVGEIEQRRRAAPAVERDDPDFNLALRGVQLAGVSPVGDCPSVAEFLDQRGIDHPTVELVQQMTAPFDQRLASYPWSIVRMSMPAIDKARGIAWFSVEKAYGMLAGGSFIVTYHRVKGRWIFLDSAQTTIS